MFLILIIIGLASLPIMASILFKRDLLSPINIFSFLYAISFGIVPLLSRFDWIMADPAFALYDPVFDTYVHILAIVGLVLVYLGYYEGFAATAVTRALPVLKGVINTTSTKLLILIFFIISGLSFLFFALYFNIQIKHITDYFIYTNISAFGRGYLAFLALLYLPAGFVAIMGIFNKQPFKHRLFFFVALSCTITLAIFSRSRGQVLLLIFVLLVFYNYRVKQLTPFKLAITFAAMLVVVFTMAQLRGSGDFSMVKSNVANTFGWLFEEHQATAALLSEYSRNNIDPANGKIFIEETILALIPRKIWPAKPKYYGGVVITDTLVPNRQPGYYYTIGTFSLAYADFGYVGIIISMILIGFITRVVYEYLKRNQHNNGMLLWYALFCFNLWAFIRGGWGFMPVVMEKTILVFMIYYFITHAIAPRSKVLKNT